MYKLLIWRRVVRHQCSFASSEKLYQFLKYNHGYCEILEVIYTGIHYYSYTKCTWKLLRIHTTFVQVKTSIFHCAVNQTFKQKMIKQWKKLIFNVNAALFHNYNLINYFRKYIYDHFKTLNGQTTLCKISSMFPLKIPVGWQSVNCK